MPVFCQFDLRTVEDACPYKAYITLLPLEKITYNTLYLVGKRVFKKKDERLLVLFDMWVLLSQK